MDTYTEYLDEIFTRSMEKMESFNDLILVTADHYRKVDKTLGLKIEQHWAVGETVFEAIREEMGQALDCVAQFLGPIRFERVGRQEGIAGPRAGAFVGVRLLEPEVPKADKKRSA